MSQFTDTLDTEYESDEDLPNRDFDILSLLMVPAGPGGGKVNTNLDQLFLNVSLKRYFSSL